MNVFPKYVCERRTNNNFTDKVTSERSTKYKTTFLEVQLKRADSNQFENIADKSSDSNSCM